MAPLIPGQRERAVAAHSLTQPSEPRRVGGSQRSPGIQGDVEGAVSASALAKPQRLPWIDDSRAWGGSRAQASK